MRVRNFDAGYQPGGLRPSPDRQREESVPVNIYGKPAVESLWILKGPQILKFIFDRFESLTYRITLGNRRSRSRFQNFLKLFAEIFVSGKLRNHRMRSKMDKIPCVGNC